MQYLSTISIMTEWSQFISKANHSTLHPSLCSNHKCHRRWSWPVLWRPTRTYRTNTKKIFLFHYRGLKCKSRKSTDTWSNRKVWAWSIKWSRAKVNRVLPKEHTGHHKHPLPTRDDSMYGHHQIVDTKIRLITFFVAKDGEALYSQQKWDLELWPKWWASYCKIQA